MGRIEGDKLVMDGLVGTVEGDVIVRDYLEGSVDDPVELGPGDYISYPGDLLHTFKALEPDCTAVLISEHV